MSIAGLNVAHGPAGTPKVRPRYCSEHAISRVSQRYGVALADADFDRIVMLIERDDPRTMRIGSRPQANGHLRYIVLHKDLWLPVVFNPDTSQVVTVLPPNVLVPYRDRLERLRGECLR
jgi:hypothetical protein